MKAIRSFGVLFLLGFSIPATAQRNFAPLDPDYYHLYDRIDISGVSDTSLIHTSVKPYNRQDIYRMMYRPTIRYSDKPDDLDLSDPKIYNIQYLKLDNTPLIAEETFRFPGDTFTPQSWPYLPPLAARKGFFSHFYRIPSAFLGVYGRRDLWMVANPVLGFGSGIESPGDRRTWQNTRGFQIHGSIGRKLGFHTFVTENQFRFPSYYTQFIEEQGVLQGAGLIKDFGDGGYDFLDAKGSITFSPIDEIMFRFGHDNHFIGNGYRSLILSDNARENLFLEVRTRVWRLQYTNLFMELSDLERLGGTGNNQRKKFMAFHHLNLKLHRNFSIGMFESIVFARNDSNDVPGYDIQYLNPIIFYRVVEHGLNSSDNSLLGIDWKWNLFRRFSFYGQVVLDELRKDSIIQRTGWWGNKWALQAGLKYINVAGISHLDLQLEANIVRPYTYTHDNRSQNYIHHNQSMAHPLGANFREYIGIIRYQPTGRWRLTGLVMLAEHGRDSVVRNPDLHYGGNVLEDYTRRPEETGIEIGQGFKQHIIHAEFRASWQFYHNVFMDFVYIKRYSEGPIPDFNFDMQLFQIGFRMNLPYWRTDY